MLLLLLLVLVVVVVVVVVEVVVVVVVVVIVFIVVSVVVMIIPYFSCYRETCDVCENPCHHIHLPSPVALPPPLTVSAGRL